MVNDDDTNGLIVDLDKALDDPDERDRVCSAYKIGCAIRDIIEEICPSSGKKKLSRKRNRPQLPGERRPKISSSSIAEPMKEGLSTVASFCKRNSISRGRFYDECDAERLKTVLLGRRRYITPEDERAWIALLRSEE